MESKTEGRFAFKEIHDYISKNEYPSSFSKEDKRALKRRAKCFQCQDGQIFYVGSAGKHLLFSHCETVNFTLMHAVTY